MNPHRPVILFVMLIVLTGGNAYGQQTKPKSAATPPADSSAIETLNQALEQERKLNEEQQQQITEQQQMLADQQAAIEELQTSVEDLTFGSADWGETEQLEERSLDIFGFFDVTFMKMFPDEGSPYALGIHDTSTFYLSSLNVYLKSQLTSQLAALSEIHFSFLPHGIEQYYDLTFNGEPIEGVHGQSYQRVNQRYSSPLDSQVFTYGGVMIERAHVTYTAAEWLYIMAGRFITPYGIWNVDHSPVVVLPVRVPYMQLREFVPLRQTGLQIGGRFFPTDRLLVDYAITLSNGRGPIEAIIDLDENKAIGLRLKLEYERDRFKLSLGGYGFVGKYTNIRKVIEVAPNPDSNHVFDVGKEVTKQYREIIGSADLRLELFNVILQAEYVWAYTKYLVPTPLSLRDKGFIAPNAYTEVMYESNFIAYDVYTILGWRLPLQQWLGAVFITPYVAYEYNLSHPTYQVYNVETLLWGVNVKPSSYLALKVEGGMTIPRDKTVYGDTFYNLTAQIAVYF